METSRPVVGSSAMREVGALEADLAAHDAAGRPDEAEQGVRRHRLAGARLADDAQDLARAYRKAHAVDGLHEAVLGGEMHGEVVHLEELAHRTPRMRGSRRSRRVSPTRLNASTVSMMARPGKSTSHHSPETT